MEKEFSGYYLFGIFSLIGPIVFGLLKKERKELKILYIGSFFAGITVVVSSKDRILFLEPFVFMLTCFIFYCVGYFVRFSIESVCKFIYRLIRVLTNKTKESLLKDEDHNNNINKTEQDNTIE